MAGKGRAARCPGALTGRLTMTGADIQSSVPTTGTLAPPKRQGPMGSGIAAWHSRPPRGLKP